MPALSKSKKADPLNKILSIFLPNEQSVMKSQEVLLLGSNNGMLAAYLARLVPSCQIWATDITVNSIQLLNQIAQKNSLLNIHTFPDLSDPEWYLRDCNKKKNHDVAIILLPKGRKVARRWLLQAYQCLKDAGVLYLAGANDAGIKAVAKDASELFSNINVLGYKHGTRLYRAVKQHLEGNIPGWTSEPGISLGSWNEYKVKIREQLLTLRTLPGVFSFDHLDPGTQLLLECINILDNTRILDIGCGCGIMGMLAARLGAKDVHLADNHLLSVVATQENLRLNDIRNATVYASDLYVNLPETRYNIILSNPPYHTGKEVDYRVARQLIVGGYQRLERGGSLTIVANRFIRYQNIMSLIFGNVHTISENSKFHVLSSQKV